MTTPAQTSYAQIIKSSSIIGGAAVIGLLLGMVRIKFTALLIGAVGTGLAANFSALQGFIGTLAGLGIQSSAVREVASAYAEGDQKKIAETILTLRRVCLLSGLLGMITMMLLSPLLSRIIFGTNQYQLDIAALGVVILLSNITGGQMALMQGTRRIADIARMQIISALIGTVVGISFYFWLGLSGIVPALVAMALLALILSFRFSRLVPVNKTQMTWMQSLMAAKGMVRLGMAIMWTGLLGSAVSLATNTLITQQFSLQAVGIYSCALAMSGMFVNYVLGAMGADYYPRLVGAALDKESINRLVNEQIETGLLLAAPGLLATMTFSPWIIHFIYTEEFLPAVGLLQLLIIGCLGRVISWPLGYVSLALGKSKWYLAVETASEFIHFLLILIGIFFYKEISAVAIAFPVLTVITTSMYLFTTHYLTNFKWSIATKLLIAQFLILFAIVYGLIQLMSDTEGMIFGIGVTIATTLFSLRGLVTRLGDKNKILNKIMRISIIKSILRL
jgi:antigen flippase